MLQQYNYRKSGFMRKGPHPLPVHLGMIAANMHDTYGSNVDCKSSLNEVDAIKMMRGIKMYQEHSFIPMPLPSEKIWESGCSTIKRPMINNSVQRKSEYPLLLVPSLINKANILDISEEKSMLRWFNNQGIDTYLLDWGDLNNIEEKDIEISDLINKKLCGALREVSEFSGKPVDVLGYCMGGTLLLSSCAFASEHIRRMALIAAPIDFNTGANDFARYVRISSPSLDPFIRAKGCLPASWVQSAFATIDPNGSAQKFINFAAMDQGGKAAELFVSVEDWLNDGVDLPKNIAHHCIQEWFVNNKLVEGNYNIDGMEINISNINKDILIIASNNDKIVPLECAVNLHKNLGLDNVEVIELNCGHIGLIVGKNAIKDTFNPIFMWLCTK